MVKIVNIHGCSCDYMAYRSDPNPPPPVSDQLVASYHDQKLSESEAKF